MRRLAAIMVVAAFAAVTPAWAQDACSNEAALESSLCRADRPLAVIAASPSTPRAGSIVVLRASGGGRDATYDWDLDDDGAFDDATGAQARTSFAAGTHGVGVRATDQFGRTGTEKRTFFVHDAFDAHPTGTLAVTPASTRVGRPVTVHADGTDPDGQVTKVELDLDGDGVYEISGDGPSLTRETTYATAGTRTVRARFTDDVGATSVHTVTVDAHPENLAPLAQVTVAQGDGSYTIGAPLAAGDALVTVRGGDPDGTRVHTELDLDGDGVYERDAGYAEGGLASFAAPAAQLAQVHTDFAAGDHVIGVRVTDADGASQAIRRSVLATPAQGPPVVLELAGTLARPGAPVTLSASDLQPGATFTWDADGDGEFDDGTGSPIQFTYPSAGTYEARVKAAGAGGERVAMATVTVRDAPALPPVIDPLNLPSAARAGEPFTVFGDPRAPDGGPSSLTVGLDLDGDGEFDDTQAGGAHFPAGPPFMLGEKAADGGGRFAVRTDEVAPLAGNLAPYAWIVPIDFSARPGDPAILAGRRTTLLGAIGDDRQPGTVTPAWDADGDGDYDDGATGSIALTFSAGEHTIGLRATDADGAATAVRDTFTVGSRPPVATFSVAGSSLTSTTTDPDGDAIVSLAWDLDGDRAFDDATGPSASALPGEHVVGLEARDAGGDIGIAYAKVTGPPVTNLPPITPAPIVEPLAEPLALGASVKSVRLKALLKSGLAVTVRCSAACRATVVVKRAGKQVGRASGKAGVIRVKLTAKARKALQHARSVKLTLTVSAPGAKPVTKTLTVRR